MLESLKDKITYVYQKERKGFGHAVYQCHDFANNEPVLLLLGDMIYHSNSEKNCMSQMIDAYEATGLPIVSMHRVNKNEVVHYGIMSGEWENAEESILKIETMVEKPTVEFAEDYLSVKTKDNSDNYYAVFGQYVLTKDVFNELKKNIDNNYLERGEFQLTSALDQTREKIGLIGLVVNGVSYDIGLPDQYINTVTNYHKYNK